MEATFPQSKPLGQPHSYQVAKPALKAVPGRVCFPLPAAYRAAPGALRPCYRRGRKARGWGEVPVFSLSPWWKRRVLAGFQELGVGNHQEAGYFISPGVLGGPRSKAERGTQVLRG